MVARRSDRLQSAPSGGGEPPVEGVHAPPPSTSRRAAATKRAVSPETPERRRLAALEAESRSLASQNALLKQLVTVYDQMTGMVLLGADIGSVTRLLSDLITRPVRVFDALLQPLAFAGSQSDAPDPVTEAAERLRWTPGDPQLAQMLENLAEGRRPVRIPPMPGWGLEAGLIVAPIVAGDDILGYLTIFERAETAESTNLDLLVVQHAATVYALTLTRERLSADVANRLREDLLEGVLLGQLSDPLETEHRAVLLGYDSRRVYRVLLVRPEPESGRGAASASTDLARRRRVLETTVEYVGRMARDAIAVTRSEEVVILVPEPRDEYQTRATAAIGLGGAIVERMRHPFPSVGLTMAISGPCAEVSELPAAYAQARRTLAAARQFGREGQITTFEELGIYRLLFQVPNASELHGFADQVLGALVSYDRRHEADLVRTLAAYLRHHGRLQSAARDLVVHVNTVSYRLQRIREIAGLDLDNSEDRLTAQVALKILDGLEQR
jgi:purine catabolism regulator